MPTAQQLINTAVGLLGAATPNTDVGASESADCLRRLNSMLDSWRIERLSVYQIVQRSLAWPSGANPRSIGSGGQFSVERPDKIEGAFSVDSNSYTRPIRVLEDLLGYDAIPNKTITSDIPQYLYYDTAYPLGFLYLYPVPSTAITVLLDVWQVLQSFTALATNLLLPPGYQFAIENNLAMALSPFYPNAGAVQLIAPLARSSKAAIQRINAKIGVLRLDPGLVYQGRRWNIQTGM